MKYYTYFLFLSFLLMIGTKVVATPIAQPSNYNNLSMEWLYQVASYSSYSLDIPEIRNNLQYYINMTQENLKDLEEMEPFKDKLQFNHTAKHLKKFLATACCMTAFFIFCCKAGTYHPSDVEAEMLITCAVIVGTPAIFLGIAGLSDYNSIIDIKSRLKERLITTRNILIRLQDIQVKMQQEKQ